MSTKLTYLLEPEQLDIVTTITHVTDDRCGIILDRTPFYVQGGGQPSDVGRLRTKGGDLQIVSVNNADGFVIHTAGTGVVKLTEGEEVQAQVDHVMRLFHCRLHTAGELLCLAVRTIMPKWDVVSAIHFPTNPSVTFRPEREGEPLANIAVAIETEINRHIDANYPVFILNNVARAEAERLVNYSLAGLPPDIPIRLVNPTPGFYRACMGTHVHATGDIGPVTIRKLKQRKGMITVSYAIGEPPN